MVSVCSMLAESMWRLTTKLFALHRVVLMKFPDSRWPRGGYAEGGVGVGGDGVGEGGVEARRPQMNGEACTCSVTTRVGSVTLQGEEPAGTENTSRDLPRSPKALSRSENIF